MQNSKIGALIRKLLDANIYQGTHVIRLNHKLNAQLLRLITQGSSQAILAKEIYDVTDEMAVLAETATHASTLEYIGLSRRFSQKQAQLKEFYKTYQHHAHH